MAQSKCSYQEHSKSTRMLANIHESLFRPQVLAVEECHAKPADPGPPPGGLALADRQVCSGWALLPTLPSPRDPASPTLPEPQALVS